MARHLIFTVFASLIFFSCNRQQPEKELVVQYMAGVTTDEIVPLEDTLVRPVVYLNNVKFSKLSPEEKKEKFIAYILPSILIQKHQLEEKRNRIIEIEERATAGFAPDTSDVAFIKQHLKEYKATSLQELKEKLELHPASLIIAQAALESGWGTSKVYLKGNNLFGMYGFNGRMVYYQDTDSLIKDYRLKKYTSVAHSVEDYIKNIARSRVYKKFRKERIQSDDPVHLIKFLNKYSVNDQYAVLLKQIIRKNNLYKYDKCILHPEGFQEVKRSESLFAGIPLF